MMAFGENGPEMTVFMKKGPEVFFGMIGAGVTCFLEE